MKRIHSFIKENPVWTKVLLFSLTLFFLRMADGIIAFWAPNQIQNSLNNSLWMGLIISFQSIVGFAADLVFPTLLKNATVKKLVLWGILLLGITSFLLVSTAFKPLVLVFMVTMLLWGVYYEFISFANYQFMGSVVPLHMRSGAWGITGIFSNLAYFLGPLAATILLLKGYWITEAVFMGFLIIGFLLLISTKNMHDAPVQIDIEDVNPWVELKHWFTLTKHIWPAIVLSVLLGFIDSTFWTTGAIWTEKLAMRDALGGLFLPLYQFPPIILGLVMARWGIYKGKKILAEKFLIVAGLFLIFLAAKNTVIWQLTIVLFASVALSVCYPLLEGVYTDIVARMGKEKKDMIGLTSSTTNLSYIVWPPVAGFISSRVGEQLTFSILGIGVVIIGVILLFVTPKKLRLPQEEISTWD